MAEDPIREAKNKVCSDGHLNAALNDILGSREPDAVFCALTDLAHKSVEIGFKQKCLTANNNVLEELLAKAKMFSNTGSFLTDNDFGRAYSALLDASTPSVDVDRITSLLEKLSEDERLEIFSQFCHSCGRVNKVLSCNCWNDE